MLQYYPAVRYCLIATSEMLTGQQSNILGTPNELQNYRERIH